MAGPRPVGDPEGMRAFAASLRALADDVGGRSDGATAAVEAMDYDGPRATRVRAQVEGAAGTVRGAAGRLQSLAGDVEG